MVMSFSANSAKKYVCEFCDVNCIRKNDWDRHIITQKHVGNVSGNKKSARTIFACEICEKIYKSQKGLWGHKKTCNIKKLGHCYTTFCMYTRHKVLTHYLWY